MGTKFNILLSLSFFISATLQAQTCRPLFSQELFSTKISTERIQAAMKAELAPPTTTISVRSETMEKDYLMLDNPQWWGQHINVDFFDNRYVQPGEAVEIKADRVPQLVLTKDFLDQSAQKLIQELKRQSGWDSFQEVGGWIIYTDKHIYVSEVFGETHKSRHGVLGQALMMEQFEKVYKKVINNEGPTPVVADIEFYHTHYSRGEALAPGDYEGQRRYFRKRFKKILSPEGVYSIYAIPIQGEVIFRHAIPQSAENVW